VFENRGLEKAEGGLLLHKQNSNAAVSSGACLESAMKQGSKAVQEYSAVAYKKDVMVQILCFAQNRRWVLAAVPGCWSPSSFLGRILNLASITDFSFWSGNQIPQENVGFGTAFASWVIDSAVPLGNIQA